MSMNELKPGPLARPMDRNLMASDDATLRLLVKDLNNPLITGAEVPAAGVVSAAAQHPAPADGGEFTIPPEVIPTAPAQVAAEARPSAAVVRPPAPTAAPPAAKPKHSVGLRLLFTGRNLDSIISAIPATEFGILSPVIKLAEVFFSGVSFAELGRVNTPGANSFINTLRAWGAGEISETYPVTEIRACFVTMIRSLAATGGLDRSINWARFGSDGGFWIDIAVSAAQAFQAANPERRFVVTGVTTKEEFQYFRALGLQHWHVMARPGVGLSDALSNMLDNETTKVISLARTGAKLRVVWSDASAPASARLWTAAEFKQVAQ